MTGADESAFALSLGLAGSVAPEVIREAARAAEQGGFHALWLNDTPSGDALAGLAVAAEVTTTLRLATGVIPFDRRTAAEIAARVDELELPHDRLIVGVGSGAARHPLGLVAEGVADLQARLDMPIVLGALGPAMRRLGAERADGLLLSWLTPATASVARDQAITDAGGRAAPRVVLYVRAAAEPNAMPALEQEAARYAGYPNYAANFARLGHGALDATIRGVDEAPLASGIDAYAGTVDELVLRAITVDDSAAAVVRFIDAAGGLSRGVRAPLP
jgi:alkanesulfonate monooxygenase SsuD/methylene tetrahydromethanopterin reductase-like flavin-dependent oxidoreductase (luciferase family)